MYQMIAPFKVLGSTNTLSVTTSSATTAIPRTTNPSAGSIRIVNSGANILFFSLGDAGVSTSVATGTAMLPNTVESFYLGTDKTHIAIIGSVAGNSVYITFGESA